MHDADAILDASGLNCPLPVLKTRKSLSGLQVGQTLQVISTDPGSKADMQAFAEATGHRLLKGSEEDGKFVFLIEKTS
ncbi:MAG: sulfurtransferase TusA family protein [Rhodospirillales bacterium]